MKKLNYFLLGLAGLTMASCSQDDLLNGGTDGNYAITVKLPADMATRASLGDNLLQAQNLHYAVFDMGGNFIEVGSTQFPEGSSTTTVPLNLASGSSFQIAFFAQSPQSETDEVYSFNASAEAHSITVDYKAMESGYNNADDYDCFYKLFNTGVIGSSTNTQVVLNRLVAQINWGTSDFDVASVKNTYGDNLSNLEATLSTEAYTVFDLITQEVSSPANVKIGAFTPNNAAGAPTFPVNDYEYVAMQYVLVPAEKTLQTLTLDVTNGASANTTINVENAPLQANYRTNIYGTLLTDNIEFTVELSDEWGGADYQVVESSSAFADALKAGGNVVLNSDIQLPSTEVLYVTNNVVLDLNGYTIYSNVAQDGSITVNGGNLTIKGNGSFIDNNPNDKYQTLVGVNKGTLTIEGGDFTGYGAGQVIYVQEGTANINGGTFKLADDSSGDNWCINCKDGTYNKTSFVNVTGGMFYEWNPANTNSEGNNTNYVADGYQSVATTIDGDTWYVVVPEGASGETVKVVTSTTDMADAITNATGNTTIYVTPNSSVELPNNISNKTLTIKGLNPETSVIDSHNAYWTYDKCNLSFEDVTFNTYVNIYNHTSMGFINSDNQTYNNVKFIGEFHVFTGDASFTDCDFEYYNPSGTNYQLWCQTDGTVNITNCTMNCNNAKAILVYGWPGDNGAVNNSVGGDININGLTVTSIGNPNDKAVVEIHSEIYTKAGTIKIDNVTYPSSFFEKGLWQEKNNNTEEPTKFYTIYVNGVEEQVGTQTNN